MASRRYFLSIGSNVSPEKNVPACLEALRARFTIMRISSVYETPPFGPCGSATFLNLALEMESGLSREKLQEELSKIEEMLGRQRERTDKFAPRTIDIDLLPKPGCGSLAFVMIPLAEIAPGGLDTKTGLTFAESARLLADSARAFRKIDAPWARNPRSQA